ncbi:hypothetical protein [Paenibacillus albidus]|nr:hypothetical protein [Paenibacillus albidus]
MLTYLSIHCVCRKLLTASNVLALEKAGFKNVRLYAGSWSD